MIRLVLAFAFIVRIISLNQSLWLDEATTGLVARDMSWVGIFSDFLPGDFHPPLYYLMVKGWGQIFGFSEISLRAPSVFFGVGTVYLVYLIGTKIKNNEIGLVGALLMAGAPLHVYYSQEARFYSLTTFLVALLVYFYLKLLKKPARRDWFYFSAGLAVLGLSDYLPLLIVPIFWIWAYLNKKGKKDRGWIRNFAIAHVPLVIGFLVIGDIFMEQISGGLSASPAWSALLGSTNLKNLLLVPVKFMLGRINFGNQVIYGGLTVGMGLLSMWGITRVRRDIANSKEMGFLIGMWLVVPVTIGVIVGFFVPVLQYFRFLFVLPAFYILTAVGLYKLKERHFLPIFGAILVLNMFFSMRYLGNVQFHREDWRGLARHVSENSEENAPVVFVKSSQMEGYRFYDNERVLLGGVGDLEESVEVVWLMRYLQDVFDPGDGVRIELEEEGYVKESEHGFNGVVVWKYQK